MLIIVRTPKPDSSTMRLRSGREVNRDEQNNTFCSRRYIGCDRSVKYSTAGTHFQLLIDFVDELRVRLVTVMI